MAYHGPLPPGTDPLVSAGFGGWWERSLRLLAAAWRPLAVVQLIWAVPLLIVTILGNVLTGELTNETDISYALLAVVPATGLVFLIGVVAQLAGLHVLVQQATGRTVSVSAALAAGLRRTPAMIGWGILGGLMIAVGLVLCVLPGVYVALVLTPLPAIVLLERGRGIGRAFQIVHARFGDSAARLGVILAVTLLFLVVEGAVGQLLGYGFVRIDADVSGGVATAVLSALFTTVSGVVVTPLVLTAYADMRARRETFSTAYLTEV